MRKHQRGMTFIGLMFVMALVGLVVYAGIRLVPVYLNYLKIARTLEMTATEIKGDQADPGSVRRIIERHWQIEDPSVVDVKDVQITKEEDGISMHVVYDDPVPYIANVSLSVHFDKTVKIR